MIEAGAEVEVGKEARCSQCNVEFSRVNQRMCVVAPRDCSDWYGATMQGQIGWLCGYCVLQQGLLMTQSGAVVHVILG